MSLGRGVTCHLTSKQNKMCTRCLAARTRKPQRALRGPASRWPCSSTSSTSPPPTLLLHLSSSSTYPPPPLIPLLLLHLSSSSHPSPPLIALLHLLFLHLSSSTSPPPPPTLHLHLSSLLWDDAVKQIQILFTAEFTGSVTCCFEPPVNPSVQVS